MKTPASVRLFRRQMVLGFLLSSSLAGAAENPIPTEHPTVLVLNSYHDGYIWSDGVMEGIQSVFTESGIDARVSIEYLDAKHFDPALLSPQQLKSPGTISWTCRSQRP